MTLTRTKCLSKRASLRVLSVLRSRARRESGKKKCRRPKLRRSLRQISRAKTLMAPGNRTGSSSVTCRETGGTAAAAAAAAEVAQSLSAHAVVRTLPRSHMAV